MKKFNIFTLFAFLLIGCSNSTSMISSQKSLTYTDLLELHIEWSDLLKQKEEEYVVYIYKENCFYCNKIKNDVLNFASNNIFPIYFVEYCEEIEINDKIDETIGCSKIEEIFIAGTPTLLEIRNSILFNNFVGATEVLTYLKFLEEIRFE